MAQIKRIITDVLIRLRGSSFADQVAPLGQIKPSMVVFLQRGCPSGQNKWLLD